MLGSLSGGEQERVALACVLADPAARLEEASVACYQMSQHYGLTGKTVANLNPYTGTLQDLPQNAGMIVLPKVGTEAVQTEEQTRESLRRFIASTVSTRSSMTSCCGLRDTVESSV